MTALYLFFIHNYLGRGAAHYEPLFCYAGMIASMGKDKGKEEKQQLMFGKNIKVHFAGLDNNESNYVALVAADVRYALFSVYPYLASKKPDDDFRLPENHMIKRACRENFKNVIMDSGVFTMMYGRDAGKKQTLESLTEWQDKIIEFVLQNDLNVMPVEIDCQKILGSEEAWYLRERMRKLLPDHRQINVWHFEDGIKGLDRLIEFTDYIAIGLPEWRKVKGKDHKKQIRYVTHYIKNKKPEIDIHLLGCTDNNLLAENSFCTSADSTSWLFGIKYGYFNDGYQHAHVNQFKPEIVKQRMSEAEKIYRKYDMPHTERKLRYTANGSICATISKDKYARACGPQD